jgi:hypothetical protein
MTALMESMWGTDLSAAAAQAEQLDAELDESLDKKGSGARWGTTAPERKAIRRYIP